MAIGKELGTFELRSTSFTLAPGKKKAVNVSANFEGRVTGVVDGSVITTMTVESKNAKDGKYKISSRCFLDNGEILDASGEGKTTHLGGHKWRVAGVADMSNGESYAVTGEINFADRLFTGAMYERN